MDLLRTFLSLESGKIIESFYKQGGNIQTSSKGWGDGGGDHTFYTPNLLESQEECPGVGLLVCFKQINSFISRVLKFWTLVIQNWRKVTSTRFLHL